MDEEAQQARWSKAYLYAHVISQKRLGCAVDHTAPSTPSTPSILVDAKPMTTSQPEL
jgi:hypothetical protein